MLIAMLNILNSFKNELLQGRICGVAREAEGAGLRALWLSAFSSSNLLPRILLIVDFSFSMLLV